MNGSPFIQIVLFHTAPSIAGEERKFSRIYVINIIPAWDVN